MTTRLDHKTILVTRPLDQASELVVPLEQLGANVLLQPATQILPSSTPAALDEALRLVADAQFDWLVFSSANGVRATLTRLFALFSPEQATSPTFCADFLRERNVRVAVVGSGTARALEPFGVSPSLVPKRFDAEGLVEAFDATIDDYAQVRILSLRASRGRKVLGTALVARGARYHEVEAYQSVDVTHAAPEIVAALDAGQVDAAFVTSSASGKALVAMFGDSAKKTRWIAISGLTGEAMERLGVPVARVASESTTSGLVDAAVRLLSDEGPDA